MIGSVPRHGGGGRRRSLGAAALATVLALTCTAGPRPAAAGPARLAAATGGCRAVGSSDVAGGGGPDRATVVVDTGSGAVWSACISFTGTISGIEALERAAAVITDLDPVYDQYAGLGKAVCKLRGTGTAPPDCLGKSVDSWWLSLNGKVTPKGASSLTVTDGDVEGWRYGTGGTPRPATAGTEAAAAPPPTTTRPPTPTTQAPVATTRPSGGGLTGATTPDGKPVAPTTTTRPGETTTTVKGQTTTTAEGATATKPGDAEVEGVSVEGTGDDVGGAGSADGTGESAAGAAASNAAPTGDDDGSGGRPLGAVAGFTAVIAAIAGGAVLVRRRRLATPPSPPA